MDGRVGGRTETERRIERQTTEGDAAYAVVLYVSREEDAAMRALNAATR